MGSCSALGRLFNAIDKVNSQDPNKVWCGDREVAKELLYGQRMSACLTDFAPYASEHLQIAARAQHIKRWAIARSEYPMGRQGYHQWRTELGKMHAQLAGELMLSSGYSDEDIKRVQQLLRKEKLKRDPECQTLEDVICLVFIQYYLSDFASKHSKEKLHEIIRKSWAKMSAAGQKRALSLNLSDEMLTLITQALA
jgi:hypothetical protein